VEDGKITRAPEYNAPFAIIARANGSGAVTNGGDRGTRTPNLCDASAALSRFGKVRIVGRKAKTAKEAAEGVYIIGEGMLGGKYKGIDFRKP